MKLLRFASLCGMLSLSAALYAQDRFESNDAPGHETALSMVATDIYEEFLTIHNVNDEDRFLITPPPAVYAQIEVTIQFAHADGNLDLFVYTPGYQELGRSESTGNSETVLINNTGQPFIVRVIGYNNATTDRYDLWITARDGLEPNNGLATATDLGSFASQAFLEQTASLHPYDRDWYRFEVPWDGEVELSIEGTSIPYGLGTLYVYFSDASGNSLGIFPPQPFTAGTYHMEVVSDVASESARYTVSLHMHEVPVTNLSPTITSGSLPWAIEWANSYEGTQTPIIDLTAFPCQSLVLESPLPDLAGSQIWQMPPNDPFGIIAAPGHDYATPGFINGTGILTANPVLPIFGEPDQFEGVSGNEDDTTATQIPSPSPHSSVLIEGLSLTPKGDIDCYQISGAVDGYVSVKVSHEACLGEINMFATFGGGFSSSYDAGNVEEHILPNLGYLWVHGMTFSELLDPVPVGHSPEYSMLVEIYDRFEYGGGNNDRGMATALGVIPEGEGRTADLTLAQGDYDWYRLTCPRGILEVSVEIPSPGKEISAILRVYRDNGDGTATLLSQDLDSSNGLRVASDIPTQRDVIIELIGAGLGGSQPNGGFFYDLVTDFSSVPFTLTVDNLDGHASEGSLHAVLQQLNEIPEVFEIEVGLTGLAGTIFLQEPLPIIGRDVMITGPAADCLVIDGQGTFRLFHAPESQLDLRDLTLLNGRADDGEGGGAILADTVFLNDVVIENCTADTLGGAINCDDLNMFASIIRNCSAPFGGAATSILFRIEDSALYGNEAIEGDGGALWNNGYTDFTLYNSTFSNNRAAGQGGAIWMSEMDLVWLQVDHCTFAFNEASEGGALYAPNILLPNVLYFNNSLVVLNEADIDPQLSEFLETNITWTFSYNLFSGDPHLAPLDYYGGPTPCHALWPDSSAIDAADPVSPSPAPTDQRGTGYPRTMNGRGDLGAYEAGGNPTTYSLWTMLSLEKLRTEAGAGPDDDFNKDGFSNLMHYAHFRDGKASFWKLPEPRKEWYVQTGDVLEYHSNASFRQTEDVYIATYFTTDLNTSYYMDLTFPFFDTGPRCSPVEGLPPIDSLIVPGQEPGGQGFYGGGSTGFGYRDDGLWVISDLLYTIGIDPLYYFQRIYLRQQEP
jgi:predicted outer membrane repeat protein